MTLDAGLVIISFMKNKSILILSANTGEGHNSASGAIEEIMANRQAELCIYAGGEGKDFEWMARDSGMLRYET